MKAKDLRGAAKLATDATTALADLVEAMHQRIVRLPGSKSALDGRTAGITGLAYRTVRGTTRIVGGSLDALLAAAFVFLPEASSGAKKEPRPRREALVAALNGVLGDHLARTHNPLAIPMAFRRDGLPLVLERQALARQLPGANGQLLVLIHGLCMNDLQWKREGHDHGAALARDRGFTPVYLHYNTGQPIAGNGRELAHLLQGLVDAWPCRVQRVVLLGHSMGGLLARSAMHIGGQERLGWVAKVTDLVFLGTPHHGAPLERIGHWVETTIGGGYFSAPLARLGRIRSAGITDLRHGAVSGEEGTVPLPRGVRSFALAASTGKHRADLKGRLLGDGLVPVRSALGQHANPEMALAFKPRNLCVQWGTNHMQLLSSPEVYVQIHKWLAGRT